MKVLIYNVFIASTISLCVGTLIGMLIGAIAGVSSCTEVVS
jgi:ABC-type dipeptide/oligopeptide/nickel transport system permease subunit